MSEFILGNNHRQDEAILAEKAKKSFDLQGGNDSVTTEEINHDRVCEEFAALVGVTKMDRHWKILMMLRASGLPIDSALVMAQKHGFLKGVRINEAICIEAAAMGKLKDTLRGQGIGNVVDKHKVDIGLGSDSIKIAVPEQGTPKTEMN